MKKILKIKLATTFILVLFVGIFVGVSKVQASGPVLNFSDIESGPKNGLNDGYGEGSIITIWGNNLGDMQGASTIFVGGVEASYVYYWGRADGTSGPADLYSRHAMQEISFSVDSDAIDGLGNIFVIVDGVHSNLLPFIIRSGNIYHVMTLGDNINGDGSFDNPWKSTGTGYSPVGAAGLISAGDTVYIHDGVREFDTVNMDASKQQGLQLAGTSGVFGNPVAFIAYPGALIEAKAMHYGVLIARPYMVLSKWKMRAGKLGEFRGVGISTHAYARLIANNITDREVELGTIEGCADGYQAAISGSNLHYKEVDGVKIYGNYVFEWGCAGTSKLEHTTYMTNRSGSNGTPLPAEAWEFGWNYLKDNMARQGIHNYDENITSNGLDTGDLTGVLKIHNNVIENQRDVAIDVSIGTVKDAGIGWTCPVEIYNNLIINSGLGPYSDFNIQSNAITISGDDLESDIKIYNNTIYDYSEIDDTGIEHRTGINLRGVNLNRTVEIKNNIFYDTKGANYISSVDGYIPIVSTNLYYSTQNDNSAPLWDGEAIEADPMFELGGKLKLQSFSPAIDTGITGVFNYDIYGTSRPQNSRWDIGAYEYQGTDSVVIRADVNQDLEINSTDAMLTLRNSLGLDMTNTNWNQIDTTGDVNCDNSSNSIDAVLLLRYSLGLDMSGANWCE